MALIGHVSRRAGLRRHRVALQSMTGRTAAGDGYTEAWATYATVWAGVETSSAWSTERQVGQTMDATLTHRVELDYRADVRVRHRLLLGGSLSATDTDTRKLYVRGMENVGERNKTLVLACEERTT